MHHEATILPSHKIDKQKWNACIQQSANGLIYASTDYLNYMADNWTGIILNDYDAVMPVAFRKKLGISYCYDVPFIQQLGMFSKAPLINHDQPLQLLLKVIQYGDYNFNFSSSIKQQAVTCNNYILPLNIDYSLMSQYFSKDTIQNIKKSQDKGLGYSAGSIDEAVDLYIDLYKKRTAHVTGKDYDQFKHLAKFLEQKQQAIVRKVTDTKGETLAIVLLLKDERRLYNLMNSTTSAGRKMEANYFLLSEVWKEFENSNLLFDFEGSDITGIQSFYEKFGAVNQPYQRLHVNRLPSAIRWLKR